MNPPFDFSKKSAPFCPPPLNAHPLAAGDRVAFITLGRQPRTLCGIVVDVGVKDRKGRSMHRVLTSGKYYFASPHAIRRLVLKRF